MAYTLLGRIRPVYKGAWSASTAYTALEMVKSADGRAAYIALKDVLEGVPVTNGSYWGVVLDVSDVLDAADAAIAEAVDRADEAAERANAAAYLAPKPLALTEEAEPALIWPEPGSPLRPAIRLNPIQPGSGDPSPDNIRPIAGLAGAKLIRCGKNLVDMASMAAIHADTTAEHGENTLRVSNSSAGAYRGARTDPMKLRAGATYTLSAQLTALASGSPRIGFRKSGGTFVGGTSLVFSETGEKSVTFTPEEDVDAYLSALVTWSAEDVGDATFANVQLETGASATAYEPYRGDAFSRAFGRTVYGGTLDMDAGALTLDHACVSLTGDETVGERTGSDGLTYYTLSNLMAAAPASGLLKLTCSHYPTANSVYSGAQGVRFTDSLVTVMLRDSRFQDAPDAEGLKAYFAEQAAAGTPVQICYELATPETVQLTATAIPALEGLNAVFADGGGLTVAYNKSLVREHEELLARLAALEAAAVNNA